jgi:DNA-binding Lrp family transcriptional regulator
MLTRGERKVLLSLLTNARKSFSQIAKETHMTRQTVSSIIGRLEKNGALRSYVIRVDKEKVGIGVRAYVLVTKSYASEDHHEEFDRMIQAIPEVSQVHHVFGRYDLLVEMLAPNLDALKKILRNLERNQFVARTETLVVSESIKDNRFDPIKLVLEDGLEK